ncbi:tetratricopeptide repeat protein [Panacibacter ginsenosidivorans]|uniref:tetratricopeptide repeat protein n=1 Tax=Panacibacter ginsenosidivorans TaxID=1813871 RepID=UPI00131545E5|nr:tetratricopeptide repeat protein [Panacibacter ginsenosidivorans]
MNNKLIIKFIFLSLLFSSCKANEDLLEEAYQLSKEKKYNDAIKIYNEVILDNNKIQLAYYNRGFCYFSLKNYSQALRDFNRVISLQTHGDAIITYNDKLPYSREEDRTQVDYFDALYQRAQVKFYMDSIKSSFADFQILIDNNYVMKSNCILWQGTLYIKSGNKSKACDYFQKAKELGDEEANEMIDTYCK